MSEKEVARKAFGTKLKRGNEYVARLLNISPPEFSRADIDVTNHDSPGGFKEFIPGLKEAGEVPIEGHLFPTDDTQKGLLAAVDIDEPEPWVIEFPTVPKMYISFDGYVKSFKVGNATVDGVITFSAAIKVTGKPVIETDESAGLTALSLSGGTELTPPFDAGVYEYFASVLNETGSIKVIPEAAGHIITVNGAIVETEQESGAIPLAAGKVTAITIKAWEDGRAPAVYVIKVYREREGV